MGRDHNPVSIGYIEDDNPTTVPRWAYELIREGAIMDYKMEQLKKKRCCQQTLERILDKLKAMPVYNKTSPENMKTMVLAIFKAEMDQPND